MKDENTAPQIDLIDEELWIEFVEANKDPAGRLIMKLTHDWAMKMEFYIKKGESIKSIYSRSKDEVGLSEVPYPTIWGIKLILKKCWRYGGELENAWIKDQRKS